MGRLVCLVCVLCAWDCGAVSHHRSKGCDRKVPSWVELGKSVDHKFSFRDTTRMFRAHVPSSYKPTAEVPLVLSFHGWGGDAAQDEKDTGLSEQSEAEGFVVVYPEGYADNSSPNGPWGSWNGGGTTGSPGPQGPTCESWAATQDYCYDSCRALGLCEDGCNWSTCQPDIPLVEYMLDYLEELLCIDTSRVYVTGMSNGGVFTYQVGVEFAHRLAAIAPMCGSFHRGFAQAPNVPLPLLDIHGDNDRVVPANFSLSADGWFYTPLREIVALWSVPNECDGRSRHFPTSLDGRKQLHCVLVGECKRAPIVRCAFQGTHTYFANSAAAHAKLVWEFLSTFRNRGHCGHGASCDELL